MLKLEVIGNLGADAEIKEFGNKEFVSMSVAHSERRKDGGNTTVWVSVLWRGNGGNLFQYLRKGCKVFVRGRLSAKAYIDRQNEPQCSINVYASEIILCGGRSEPANSPTNIGSVANYATVQDPSDDEDLPF